MGKENQIRPFLLQTGQLSTFITQYQLAEVYVFSTQRPSNDFNHDPLFFNEVRIFDLCMQKDLVKGMSNAYCYIEVGPVFFFRSLKEAETVPSH